MGMVSQVCSMALDVRPCMLGMVWALLSNPVIYRRFAWSSGCWGMVWD